MSLKSAEWVKSDQVPDFLDKFKSKNQKQKNYQATTPVKSKPSAIYWTIY